MTIPAYLVVTEYANMRPHDELKEETVTNMAQAKQSTMSWAGIRAIVSRANVPL